jgi:hypothetical protein
MFNAEFRNGPMRGARHEFIGADAPFPDLYTMPNPTDADGPWIVVGHTGLEPGAPVAGAGPLPPGHDRGVGRPLHQRPISEG